MNEKILVKEGMSLYQNIAGEIVDKDGRLVVVDCITSTPPTAADEGVGKVGEPAIKWMEGKGYYISRRTAAGPFEYLNAAEGWVKSCQDSWYDARQLAQSALDAWRASQQQGEPTGREEAKVVGRWRKEFEGEITFFESGFSRWKDGEEISGNSKTSAELIGEGWRECDEHWNYLGSEDVSGQPLSAEPVQPTGEDRNARQLRISEWGTAAFGEEQMKSVTHRGLRFLEEAIETYQAASGSVDKAHKLVEYVFAKPVGELDKEIGGVGVTLLALANAAGFSADDLEVKEIARILAKPMEHWTARNQVKNDADFNAAAPTPSREAMQTVQQEKDVIERRKVVERRNTSFECSHWAICEDGAVYFVYSTGETEYKEADADFIRNISGSFLCDRHGNRLPSPPPEQSKQQGGKRLKKEDLKVGHRYSDTHVGWREILRIYKDDNGEEVAEVGYNDSPKINRNMPLDYVLQNSVADITPPPAEQHEDDSAPPGPGYTKGHDGTTGVYWSSPRPPAEQPQPATTGYIEPAKQPATTWPTKDGVSKSNCDPVIAPNGQVAIVRDGEATTGQGDTFPVSECIGNSPATTEQTWVTKDGKRVKEGDDVYHPCLGEATVNGGGFAVGINTDNSAHVSECTSLPPAPQPDQVSGGDGETAGQRLAESILRVFGQKLMLRFSDGVNETYWGIDYLPDDVEKMRKLFISQFANFLNGDPKDNRLPNLRWATAKENIADRKRHGRTAFGDRNGSAKLDRACVKTIKRLQRAGVTAYEVARLACVDTSTIDSIWKGKSWKHV